MDINFIHTPDLIYILPTRTDGLKMTDEDFIISQTKEKKIKPPFLYNLYSVKYQRDYDLEDEKSPETEPYYFLEKVYLSLDEFNNDKTTKKSKCFLRKEIFYTSENILNLYKTSSDLKLEWLHPSYITLKEWGFK